MNDTFALTTGQAHKLEMAFRRTGWENAEIEVLCMGNNLALVKDLINGKLDYTYKQAATPAPKPEPKPLLVTAAETLTIAATTTQLVVGDHLVVDTSENADISIAYISPNVRNWFGGKVEPAFAGSTLHRAKLARRSVDGPIITEIGGPLKARTTWTEILACLRKQKRGGKGSLLTNGWANIFYVEDEIRLPEDEQVAYENEAGEKVVLRAVDADWSAGGGGWSLYALSVLGPGEWGGGDQFLFRDSRLPVAA